MCEGPHSAQAVDHVLRPEGALGPGRRAAGGPYSQIAIIAARNMWRISGTLVGNVAGRPWPGLFAAACRAPEQRKPSHGLPFRIKAVRWVVPHISAVAEVVVMARCGTKPP
ncbi:hypothetical protein GCM10023074_36170 [Microbispora amethystogenes]|uniref:Transposase n=1 Tax=Microbispora amethystogenes TaxID=1427754 RepID=A0ABQ4FB72_9ACTN|nr:hypothetical protein Mam01_22350 [Microbispora amethystogenes]